MDLKNKEMMFWGIALIGCSFGAGLIATILPAQIAGLSAWFIMVSFLTFCGGAIMLMIYLVNRFS